MNKKYIDFIILGIAVLCTIGIIAYAPTAFHNYETAMNQYEKEVNESMHQGNIYYIENNSLNFSNNHSLRW
jgi:hypothetical protein